MRHCTHCKLALQEESNYCAHCGQKQSLSRINGRYIISEIGSVLNFEKGFFYTIRELILRPGKSIQDFINRDRNRMVKPIIFLILCSLIYSLAQQVLRFEDGYINYSIGEESAITTIFNWITSNYGYANTLMAAFIALWIKLFFRKYKYNFYEIIILLCFTMAIGMLAYTLFGVLESLTKLPLLQFGGIIGTLYVPWAVARFFDKSKKRNYVKAFCAYMLGSILFFAIAAAIGFLIDSL